jgi:hypothetical protein
MTPTGKQFEGLRRTVAAILNGDPPRTETRGRVLVIYFWGGTDLTDAIRQAIAWSRGYEYAEFEFNMRTIRVNPESDPNGCYRAYHQTSLGPTPWATVGSGLAGPTVGPEFHEPQGDEDD